MFCIIYSHYSLLPNCHKVGSSVPPCAPDHAVVSRHTLRGMEPDNHTLKPSDKINLSSFKLLLSGISHALSPTHTHKHTHKKILHNHILLRSSMKTVRQTVLHENCTVLTSFHFLRSFFTLETSILGKFKQ